MKIGKRFVLRQAAGAYWLLDMDQPGIPYRQPIELNEVSADIWQLYFVQGKTVGETAEQMSGEYGVPADVIIPDIREFLAVMAGHGIGETGDGGDNA